MKVHECIEISRPILEAMRRAGVNLDDVKYLEMYKRFLTMKGEGLKVSYIAEKLSDEYQIRPRKFYYILKKFDCVVFRVACVREDMRHFFLLQNPCS